MSDESKPFTEYVKKTGRAPGGSKAVWVTAGLLVALLVAVILLWTSAQDHARQLQSLHADLDQTEAKLTNAQAGLAQAKSQVATLQQQSADLEKQKEMDGQTAQSLEQEMRSDLESRDVTISNLQGKLTVNILDRVMFDSGEAVMQPDGEAVLRKIGAILTEHPALKIHVIGHTDNVPIRARYPSNWELSTARALAAVHFLVEKAGVDPHRVGAVGYGEFRPIADNATPEGRARNRRIAITILSDELAGADAVPTVKTNAVPAMQPPAVVVPDPAVKSGKTNENP